MGAAVAQAAKDWAEKQRALGSRPSMDKTWQLSMLAVGREHMAVEMRHQNTKQHLPPGSPSMGPPSQTHTLSLSVCVAFSS